ncbi:hypothetical protein X773_15895 [Mesorhizobium sp. LSJC285A00]|nr:hypothetical protein X773_15895 [Mesorhizobium sp. LSJC285A00]ESX17050.1 hypothetical protein X767_26280 [Mesorhizobium sp. LSJC264A00]
MGALGGRVGGIAAMHGLLDPSLDQHAKAFQPPHLKLIVQA